MPLVLPTHSRHNGSTWLELVFIQHRFNYTYIPNTIRWQPPIIHLLDPIQPRTVHSDLVVHLIRLACNPLDVPVLRIRFLAHGATYLVETFGCAVE
jgi:hypothetical protein